MEGKKRVYSKPDLTVMYYTPSDVVMAGCTYTADSSSGACLIGGQDSESFSGTYYIGSVGSTTYIVWNYNYGTAPNEEAMSQYSSTIQSILSANGASGSWNSGMGWHIAVYNSAGWSGNAS